MKDYLVEVFNDEPTGWMRKIQIEKDDKVYRAHFFWDTMDGFDLIWVDETPEWADDLDWHELDERTSN
jgi:hypothetical protein